MIEQRKLVDQLGAFPLPVEILPFGYRFCLHVLEGMGLKPRMRMKGGEIYRTDGGHYIADLQTGPIPDPLKLDEELKRIPGIIETGLFIKKVNKVVVANNELADIITFR